MVVAPDLGKPKELVRDDGEDGAGGLSRVLCECAGCDLW